MQVISTINTTTVSIVLEKYAMTSVEKKQGKSTQKVTFEHRKKMKSLQKQNSKSWKTVTENLILHL